MRTLAAPLLVLALAACGGDGDGDATTVVETETETETRTETVTETETEEEPTLGAQCSEPEAGYSVRYPDRWHTNAGDGLPPCRFFHPEAFELPENQDVVGLAISIDVVSLAFDDLVAQVGESPAEDVREREQLTLDGREAVRIESEATGEALYPAGTPVTSYFVDLDDRTLVASTVGTAELDYERNREVLRAMVETVTVAGG